MKRKTFQNKRRTW